MARWVLLGLVVAALSACKSSDHGAAPGAAGSAGGSAAAAAAAGSASTPSSSAAGKVLELSGQVTANGKPIAVGTELAADDVVETGADGHVVIELLHNLARWSLGPNRKQKVSDSIAWKLPRNEGNAKLVIEDMTAAGRPAERSAADSEASAEAPPAPPAAEPASAAAPAPGGGAPEPKHLERHREAAIAAPAAAAPPPPPEAEAAQSASAKDEAPPPAERTARGPALKTAQQLVDELVQSPEFAACLDADTHDVSLDVSVATDGSAKAKITGKLSAKARGCIQKLVAGVKFPHDKAQVSAAMQR